VRSERRADEGVVGTDDTGKGSRENGTPSAGVTFMVILAGFACNERERDDSGDPKGFWDGFLPRTRPTGPPRSAGGVSEARGGDRRCRLWTPTGVERW